MTTYYVDNAGSNTAPYDTWAKAANKVATALSASAAGDTIYVAHTHAETTAGGITWTSPGTEASPVRLICADTGTGASATSATVTITGNPNTCTVSGVLYVHGVQILTDTSVSVGNLRFYATGVVLENVYLRAGNWASSNLQFGFAGTTQRISLKNVDIKLQTTGLSFSVPAKTFLWEGGSFVTGTSSITNVISAAVDAGLVSLSGLDLSNLSAGVNIFASLAATRSILRKCRLPASWSGALVASISGSGRAEMHDCDSGATNYRIAVQDYGGALTQETTLIRTGGASDGTTGLSWKVVTNANCNASYARFNTGEVAIWNDTSGASKTVTVEILHDSVTALTDAEVWLEVMYASSASYPVGAWTSDDVGGANSGDILATPTAQTTSAETWTTTGLTNPNKQKLSVTFTPQMKGFFIARVVVAKPSYTVYVDPVLTVA
jgi:hypothetical protein